jgi:hypothetical protein
MIENSEKQDNSEPPQKNDIKLDETENFAPKLESIYMNYTKQLHA